MGIKIMIDIMSILPTLRMSTFLSFRTHCIVVTIVHSHAQACVELCHSAGTVGPQSEREHLLIGVAEGASVPSRTNACK